VPHDLRDHPEAEPLVRRGASVKFEHVGFRYPEGQRIFEARLAGVRLGTCLPVLCEIEAGMRQVRHIVKYRRDLNHLLLQLRRSPAQEQALDNYINEMQDPKSPNYHHALTIKELRERYGLAQQDLDIGPGCLIADPQRESKGHQHPKAALLTGPCEGVGQSDSGGRQHQREAHQIGECGERGAAVREQRHAGKGQSDSARCNKPAVSFEQVHLR